MTTRARWLAESGFTLALGAGFFGFFAHTGLLAAIEAAGLRPRRVVGVSAGALAGGLWAAGLSAAEIGAELVRLRREDFWDPGLPWFGILRGRKFGDKLRAVLATTGVERVEQCRVPFAAVVHDVWARRPVALDSGPLDVAIQASCTVPVMFRPVRHGGRIWVDGGVSDRGGVTGFGEGGRVLMHWLPSRRRSARGLQPPGAVPGFETMVLVTPDLPALNPFALQDGPRALDVARRYGEQWLAQAV